MFDDESSASHRWVVGDEHSGHVEMQGTDDIDAGPGLIQPELSPEPGVEIDQIEALTAYSGTPTRPRLHIAPPYHGAVGTDRP